jgi:hypothetical protein
MIFAKVRIWSIGRFCASRGRWSTTTRVRSTSLRVAHHLAKRVPPRDGSHAKTPRGAKEFVDPGIEKRFSAFVNRIAATGACNLETVPETRARAWLEVVQTTSKPERVPKNGTDFGGDLS